MYVAVIRFKTEKPGTKNVVSYAFTGKDKDEVIQRALAYRQSQVMSGYAVNLEETLVGELTAIVSTPKVAYELVPVGK